MERPTPIDGDQPAITVAAALDTSEGVKCAVAGWVIIEPTYAAICDLLAESYPPQLGGATMLLGQPEALDRTLSRWETFGDVTWSTTPVTIHGHRTTDGFVIADQTGADEEE